MSKELEKTYNPAEIEGRLYAKWEEKKYFRYLSSTYVHRDK